MLFRWMYRWLLPLCCLCFVAVLAHCTPSLPKGVGTLATDLPSNFLILSFSSSGNVDEKSFLLFNRGKGPLTVNSLTIKDDGKGYFTIVRSPQLPLVLQPGEQFGLTLTVRVSQKTEQPNYRASLVVTSVDADNVDELNQFLIPLIVTVEDKKPLPPPPPPRKPPVKECDLEVQPDNLEFKDPKAPSIVTIQNVGDSDCFINKIYLQSKVMGKPSGFFLIPSNVEEMTLASKDTWKLSVKLQAIENQKHSDTLLIESNDPKEPVIQVSLKGEGPKSTPRCILELSTQTLGFGLVNVGRDKVMPLSIKNGGDLPCSIQKLSVEGTNPLGHSMFALKDSYKFPLVVLPSSRVNVEVGFTPLKAGNSIEGQLTILSNEVKNPKITVKLAASSSSLCLEALPNSIAFGSVQQQCRSEKRKIRLFHTGRATCGKHIIISTIKMSKGTPSSFKIFSAPALPRQLVAGQSIEVEVGYFPTGTQVESGSLEIHTGVAGQTPYPITLTGEGVATNSRTEVFKQVQRPATDILFVVDDSSSMADHQASLAKHFQSFINWAVRLNVDYNILVTTTDVTGVRFQPGCGRGNPIIITPRTPNPVKAFQTNVLVGTSGSGAEKGLEAAYQAFSSRARISCNKGFYRKDAGLSVIVVSDDSDSSPHAVEFYASFFKSLKGRKNIDRLKFSVVVGPPPNGCSAPTSGGGNGIAAPRYWQLSKELNGVQESICGNWAPTMSDLRARSFGFRTDFVLDRVPDLSSIVVNVNGRLVQQDQQNGWSYNTKWNSIHFSDAAIPPPTSTISIRYNAVCKP